MSSIISSVCQDTPMTHEELLGDEQIKDQSFQNQGIKRLKKNDGSPARSFESSPPDIPPKKRVHFSNYVEVRTYNQGETDALEQTQWVQYLAEQYIFNHICCHLEKEHKIWDRLSSPQGKVIEEAWYRYTDMVYDKLSQNGALAAFQKRFAEARASKKFGDSPKQGSQLMSFTSQQPKVAKSQQACGNDMEDECSSQQRQVSSPATQSHFRPEVATAPGVQIIQKVGSNSSHVYNTCGANAGVASPYFQQAPYSTGTYPALPGRKHTKSVTITQCVGPVVQQQDSNWQIPATSNAKLSQQQSQIQLPTQNRWSGNLGSNMAPGAVAMEVCGSSTGELKPTSQMWQPSAGTVECSKQVSAARPFAMWHSNQPTRPIIAGKHSL